MNHSREALGENRTAVRPDVLLWKPEITGRQVSLAICIATLKRQDGLLRLLQRIDRLEMEAWPTVAVHIVVADNDTDRSAEGVCSAFALESRWPLEYVQEPRRGIAFARNAAVRVARSIGVELVAFIDDDEAPDSHWLSELLRVKLEHQAHVVMGPVLPIFDTSVPDWVLRGRFFESERKPTGERLNMAYTNNVLLEMQLFDRLGGFNEEISRRGFLTHEDTEFFLRGNAAHFKIVWADDAQVYEWIPEARTSAQWLVQRSFRCGAGWALFHEGLDQTAGPALRGLLKGILLLPTAIVAGRHRLVGALRLMAVGLGYVMSKLGVAYRGLPGGDSSDATPPT